MTAYQLSSGDVRFVERGDIARVLTLSCGQCIGCRLERSRQWAVRCMHEAQMHESNAFVTLTYNDDNLPADSSLNYRHFQLFMKRLRRRYGKVRFYMCGEYGDLYGRPHFHSCLFGIDFSDRYFWRQSPAGFRLFRSPSLEEIWTFGNAEIGDVTFESAAYVARYVTKKVTGAAAAEHYRIVDPDTGEVYDRVPEFTHMSLKPGIGFAWYDKFSKEVFPHDRVVVRGKEVKPPRYYKRLLNSRDAVLDDCVDMDRYLKGIELAEDNTERRLADKEVVCRARIKSLKRNLE